MVLTIHADLVCEYPGGDDLVQRAARRQLELGERAVAGGALYRAIHGAANKSCKAQH